MDNQPNPQQFVEMLNKFLSIGELVFTALSLAGLAMHYAGSTIPEVLMIGLSGLAVVYFLSAFRAPAGPSINDKSMGALLPTLTNKVLGIAMAVCCIGILFELLGLEGSANILLIGVFSLAAGIVINVLLAVSNSDRMRLVKGTLFRAIPVCVISAYFLAGTDIEGLMSV